MFFCDGVLDIRITQGATVQYVRHNFSPFPGHQYYLYLNIILTKFFSILPLLSYI